MYSISIVQFCAQRPIPADHVNRSHTGCHYVHASYVTTIHKDDCATREAVLLKNVNGNSDIARSHVGLEEEEEFYQRGPNEELPGPVLHT
jgi:hypothetical protein